MNKRWYPVTAALLLLSALSYVVLADGYESSIKMSVILKTTTDGIGQPHHYLQTDKPEVTVAHIDFPPGSETGWHFHRVPVYAYVMQGTIQVSLEGGRMLTFTQGQPFVEVIGTPHNGRNVGQDTLKLLVFYTGEVGRPNAVKVAP